LKKWIYYFAFLAIILFYGIPCDASLNNSYKAGQVNQVFFGKDWLILKINGICIMALRIARLA
jgi:hypothetical protein